MSGPAWLEVHDPRFNRLVLQNAGPERLGEGFSWLEGPSWFADRDELVFSDLPNDRLMRWSETGGVSVLRQPSGFSNGTCRDREGRLVFCSHQRRSIERIELDGSTTVLADRFDGRRLNSPNDVVCRSDGSIWFSDPIYGISTDYEGGKAEPELPARLYRLDPGGGLHIARDDFVGPNGLAFSPDERLLYVTETGEQFVPSSPRYIRRFTVEADASLSGGERFCTVTPGDADGLRLDEAGNIWSSAADGVHCIAPDGALLGKILFPATVSNLCFGGRARSRLFVCCSQSLYAIYTNTRGCVRP